MTNAAEHLPLSPGHEGESAMQRSAGSADKLATRGHLLMRDHLIDQHRQFYPLLPFIVAGAVDGEGDAWATILAGEPGFLQSPDPYRLIQPQLFLAEEPVTQRFTFDVGHDVKHHSVRFARVEQGKYVGMLEIGGGLDLLQKPVAAEDGGQLRAKELQRDTAVMPYVVGEVHGGHPALPQLALDSVAVRQCRGETRQVGHTLKRMFRMSPSATT